jgi:hypothetical protein
MKHDFLYERNLHPFGKTWEKWATLWCNWMFSIPKKENPSLDETGKYCSINQNDENVWFLTGTFGNIVTVKRRCTLPVGKAIFFPILVKEDSLEEDSDLRTELQLIERARDATNKLIRMEATINGEKVVQLENYRVQSEVFELTFIMVTSSNRVQTHTPYANLPRFREGVPYALEAKGDDVKTESREERFIQIICYK